MHIINRPASVFLTQQRREKLETRSLAAGNRRVPPHSRCWTDSEDGTKKDSASWNRKCRHRPLARPTRGTAGGSGEVTRLIGHLLPGVDKTLAVRLHPNDTHQPTFSVWRNGNRLWRPGFTDISPKTKVPMFCPTGWANTYFNDNLRITKNV